MFINKKIFEEYSARICEIGSYFYENYREKIKVDRNRCKYILFRTDVYFTEYFLAVEIDEQNYEGRDLIFSKKKRQEALEEKLGCKFVRINTSNAKNGYDTDYEVSKIKIFISEFENENEKKTKENESTVKELEDKLKTLKIQLTNQRA